MFVHLGKKTACIQDRTTTPPPQIATAAQSEKTYSVWSHRGALVNKINAHRGASLVSPSSRCFVSPSLLPPRPQPRQRGRRALGGDQVLLRADSQCHCAPCEDKGRIEEAGTEQGAAQDTLTGRLVFVPSSPFTHTTDTVFSFSPLPALTCLRSPFPLPLLSPPHPPPTTPPSLFFCCLEQVNWH